MKRHTGKYWADFHTTICGSGNKDIHTKESEDPTLTLAVTFQDNTLPNYDTTMEEASQDDEQ